MVASTFGAAFDKLEHDLRRSIISSLNLRRKNYCAGMTGQRWEQVKVILVGDRPGPGAQKLPANHHHTPFYSTKNSSLWLNEKLVTIGVHENDIFWVNSADLNSVPTNPAVLHGWKGRPLIVALGANAEKWLLANGIKDYEKVHHPQAWKRFRSGEPYPLLGILQQALDL